MRILTAILPLFLCTVAYANTWTTDLQQYFVRRKPPMLFQGIKAGAFSPDRRTIALALQDGRLQMLRLSDLATNSSFDLGAIAGQASRPIGALAYSPNRPILAAAFPESRLVILYNTAKQKLIQRIQTGFTPQRLRFSAGGKFLLVGPDQGKDKWQMVYNVMRHKTVLAVRNPVVGAISRDERFLYYTNPEMDSNNLVEFSLQTEQTVRNRPISRFAAGSKISSLRILRNHKMLLGYRDRVVLIGREMQTIHAIIMTGDHAVDCIEARGDERFLLLGNAAGWKICYIPSKVLLPSTPLQQPCRAKLYPGGGYFLLITATGSGEIHPLPQFSNRK